MPGGQTGVKRFDGLTHNLHHELVGIATALMNLQA